MNYGEAFFLFNLLVIDEGSKFYLILKNLLIGCE